MIENAQTARIRGATTAMTHGLKPVTTAMARIPAALLLAAIWLYQRTLSPALPIVTLGRCGCRFSPTCSYYAADAIQTHGVLAGVSLAFWRLLKCTPLHPGGFDPVPPRVIRCARHPAPTAPIQNPTPVSLP